MINLIKSFGYRVFVPKGNLESTYCYFTDGVNIGYAQWGRMGTRVGTVHIPNVQCGRGFVTETDITEETLKQAFCIAPSWATSSDRASVRKYKNFEAFIKADRINSELVEV